MNTPRWDLRVAASAERPLARLPERVAAAVVEFVFDDAATTATVFRIDHRSDVYRPRRDLNDLPNPAVDGTGWGRPKGRSDVEGRVEGGQLACAT